MNRHGRRSIAKNKRLVASIDGISDAAEKLHPFMTQLDDLKKQLSNAVELLVLARSENATLMSALNTQRAVYYRMFAQGMGVSLDTVLSMAGEIETQITQGDNDGIENLRPASSEEEDDDPSA